MKQVNKWLVTTTVMLPLFIVIMDSTVVIVSLPHIQGSLNVSLNEVTWVLTLYIVATAVTILSAGWLSNIFGRKNYLLFSVLLFAISSLACGLAKSLTLLVLFRTLQGLGGGGMQPLTQSILLETFPKKEYGMAMAIFSMGIVVAPIVGPILGGWITDNWGWPWIFYINIPICIISIILIFLFIFDPSYVRQHIRKIDWSGLIFMIIGVTCLQIMLDRGEIKDWFSSSLIVYLFIVSVIFFVGFIINELKTKQPIVNLKIFKDFSYSSGCLIVFLGFFAFFGSVVLLPMYVQKLMNYTALWAGLVLGPAGAIQIILLPIIGLLTKKIDCRILLAVAIVLNALALNLMAHFNLYADFWSIVYPRIIQGAGLAFFFTPLAVVTFIGIKREAMGNATAIFNFLRSLGGSFGIAFVSSIFSHRTHFHHFHLSEQFNPANIVFQQTTDKISHFLHISTHQAHYFIYQELGRQSSMLAYNDAFFINSLIFLGLLPFLFLLKKTL
ncbi:MAG: DHA2 family efflux MFS transporter permease subunit [Campylobacterota bacterium]|nr:DHA2 family efflux MFS transporter permease subunit [Campylobacterota bacterium]